MIVMINKQWQRIANSGKANKRPAGAGKRQWRRGSAKAASENHGQAANREEKQKTIEAAKEQKTKFAA